MSDRLRIAAPIMAVVAVILGMTWTGILVFVDHAKQRDIERSFGETKQLSKVFAEQVARTIDSVESFIDFAAFQIQEHGSADQLKVMADVGTFSIKPVVQIAFVDTDGFTVATNAGPDRNHTDVRDREHIRVHLDGKIEGLYIGAPVLGRVSGKWSIQVSRKVFDKNKKFIGIIVASLDPFYFQRFWNDTVQPGQVAALFRTDGAMMSRSADLNWALETSAQRPKLIERISDQGDGGFITASADGIMRLSFFTRITDLPLIVISGVSMDNVMAPHAVRQIRLYGLGAGLTFVLLALGGWLLLFALRLNQEKQQKSVFLATMSHEIRTPLNALVGFANLLSRTPLNDEQKSYMQTMETSAMTLRNIVTDVLDLSKLDAGLLEIDKSPFNLRECCNELKKVTALLIEDKPITVKMVCASNLPETLIIDGSRFYQALLNVCANAAKFTQVGEIVISGRIIVDNDVERLVVDVSDTGPGISKAVQSKLFNPFEQGETSGRLRAAGTGLGLSISKKLMERMGGSIKVDSTPGRGATFTLELPFERTDATPALNASTSDTHQTKPVRILVADDARASRMLLRIILQKKGHIVTEAEDGVQALELMQHEDFDLVFLDMQMPRLGGLEVARAFEPHGRKAPMLVALSAQAQPEDQKAAEEAGISAYITKPLQEEQLDKVIRIVSDRKVAGL